MAYLIKATLVLTAFYLCYILGLKRETFFQKNRWFLLLGLLSAVFLPLVVIPIEVPVEPVNYSFRLIPSEIQEVSPAVPEQGSEFNWPDLLMTFYIIGLCLFLIQFLLQLGSLVLLLLRNPKLKDGLYTYVFVKRPISPFSFFKWIVYNPDRLSIKDEKLILTHEKIHVNELHSIDILLSQLACCVFWFNPLIWLYRNDLKQNLEYIADYNTQQRTLNTQYYQKLLLKTSVKRQQISLTNNFYNSSIKNRILMLQKSRSQTKRQWRFALVLPALALVLMSMNTKNVYVEQPAKTPVTSTSEPLSSKRIIEVIFTKDMSPEELDKIKAELKSHKVDMTITQLERNNAGIITAIKVDFSAKHGSANYNITDSNGIAAFYFRMEGKGSIGVGAVDKNHIHKPSITIKDVDEDRTLSTNSNVFVYKKNEPFEVIIADSADVKVANVKKEYIVIGELNKEPIWKAKDSIIVVNGYRNDSLKLVRDMDTLKGYYIKDNTPVRIKTIEEKIILNESYGKKPLVLLNGKIMAYNTLVDLNPDDIDSVTVLKADDAVTLYGDQGKDGVIIIETKNKDKENTKPKWVISKPKVNSLIYIDDEDESKNATLAYISKYTPDDILDKNKALLENMGITVKYSKIKRNKKGEITRIKIRVSDGKGSESSASWKNDDGIDGIEYGVSEGTLIARTSKQSFNEE